MKRNQGTREKIARLGEIVAIRSAMRTSNRLGDAGYRLMRAIADEVVGRHESRAPFHSERIADAVNSMAGLSK